MKLQKKSAGSLLEVIFLHVKRKNCEWSTLEFKMTDYTNSILVKMFSKDNKEDKEKLNRIKKGMWVSTRECPK